MFSLKKSFHPATGRQCAHWIIRESQSGLTLELTYGSRLGGGISFRTPCCRANIVDKYYEMQGRYVYYCGECGHMVDPYQAIGKDEFMPRTGQNRWNVYGVQDIVRWLELHNIDPLDRILVLSELELLVPLLWKDLKTKNEY